MRNLIALLIVFYSSIATAQAQSFKSDIEPLVVSSCIYCHDADTETGLNLESIGYDLTDADTFREWEKVFDRVHAGEMPPETEDRPNPQVLTSALDSLKKGLRSTSQAKQQLVGRVPARRLTKLEYGYTIQDLLKIADDVTPFLPDESDSGSFDSVGETQRISAFHIESYLEAADAALDRSIQLGRRTSRVHELDFMNSKFLNEFHDRELAQGGNVSRKLDVGIALFSDRDYLLTSYAGGFNVTIPGIYRITSRVEAFQAKTPVTFKLIAKGQSGNARLLKYVDLVPGEPETVVVEASLSPGDIFYSTLVSDDSALVGLYAFGSKNFKGRGLAVRSQKVEGPLFDTWPPFSTTELLKGTKLVSKSGSKKENGSFKVELSKEPIEHVADIVNEFASKAFRRPTEAIDSDSFISLAKPAIAEGRDFDIVLRVSLRSMLSSPQFLMFDEQPGKLGEYALANRLSYFLWKSMPDEELFEIAKQGKLSDPTVLRQQVDRMLADEKSNRFVRDFLGQWLQLYKLNATSPDEKLYPEYDEVLGEAMKFEPELFFTELINENLGLANLIDSKFTFINRRLADHYGIEDVAGQQFRRIELPVDSPRGGILTQAAVLKTTANGTVTSPVTRGNFVLTSILGTPPSPPPPTIGSIEPDTRGKTTIREILAAHRNIDSCNKCHRSIDPPGFALESFDPIGGFRTKYRANAARSFFNSGKTYKFGPKVDATGVTADGKPFSGIQEFKKHLLGQKDQIARHFISQLVVYSTGGEIQFVDREEIESMLDQTRSNDFPVRDIIHEVVQSELFRNK